MSQPLRVLLIGRRFWPHGGIDSAAYLVQLATALQRRGLDVRVLTPRYSAQWPVEFRLGELPVFRPVLAPRRDWSLGRYLRGMAQWLRQHIRDLDIIFCDSIREEAIAALEASQGTACRVVLRASCGGTHSDLRWWTTSRSARRCRAIGRLADAVIAPSSVCQRSLVAAGYAGQRIVRIEPGFAAGATRSATARQRARQALAEANADLAAAPSAPVLLCAAPMTRSSGIGALVAAAGPLMAHYPELRLWLLGDGPHRDWIYDRCRGEGLRESIAMPGSFCDSDDLLAAADLYLHPDDDGLDFWLPAAVAAELPIVTVDSVATRTLLGLGSGGGSGGGDPAAASLLQWCEADDAGLVTPAAVRSGVTAVLSDLPAARSRAAELRRLLVRTRSYRATVDRYVELFQSLTDPLARRPRSASTEALR